MRVHTLYTFDGDEPMSLHNEKILELHSFIVEQRTPEEDLSGDTRAMTPEMRAHPHYRGIRAINRLRSGAFMRDDVDALFTYLDILLARAAANVESVRIERDAAERDAFSLRAYDLQIGGMADTVARITRLSDHMREDIYAEMAAAEPSDRHP